MKTRGRRCKEVTPAAIAFSALLLLLAVDIHALQTITLTEGESRFLDISEKDLNLIKFPSPNIRVYTSSKALDIKMDGGNVFVNLVDKSAMAPQEVFFVTPSGTYSFILVPKRIPAEAVIVRPAAEGLNDAVEWERSHDHVVGLKELIKAMYLEMPPMGFSVKKTGKDLTRGQGTSQVQVSRYSGATLEGEIHELSNISCGPAMVLENEFYEKGVLAVSIDRHELAPREKTNVYIVRRSVAQRQMDELTRKYNPLDTFGGNRQERERQ